MKVPEAEAKLRAMSGYANAGYDQTETNTQQVKHMTVIPVSLNGRCPLMLG